MTYELVRNEDLQAVYDVVQHTIKTIYPKYYPTEVVDFFCDLHSKDALLYSRTKLTADCNLSPRYMQLD